MPQQKDGERGDVLVTVALMLVALLLLLILAIDVGAGYAERRKMQNAADAGALAGAWVLVGGGTDSEIRAAIHEYTVTQNEASSFSATYLPGNQVVGAGVKPSDATGLRVTAVGSAPVFFAQLIGHSTISAAAQGGGGFTPLDIVLVVDQSGSMDDDSCDFTPYFRAGGYSNCTGSVTQSSCSACKPGIWNSTTRRCTLPLTPIWPTRCGSISRKTDCLACGGAWSLPDQPVRDAENAARSFVDLNNPNLSRIGLVTFADNGSRVAHLTDDFTSLKNAINHIEDGVTTGCTNIADGMQKALDELLANGRDDAIPFVVFMTDGLANRPGSCACCNVPNCCPAAVSAAENVANSAVGRAIVFYTIGLGADADQPLLQRVADRTGGEFFYAPTSADLVAIYATIFERIKLRLVQ